MLKSPQGMFRWPQWTFRWLGERAPWVFASILVAGIAIPLLQRQPAAADSDVGKLKTTALSSLGISQRLLAVEELKVEGSTSALEALEDIARSGDLRIATAACAALGRTGSSASKAALKEVLEDTGASDNKRIAAASAIAVHWKDSGDEDYLEEKTDDDGALAAHFAILKAKVYESGE